MSTRGNAAITTTTFATLTLLTGQDVTGPWEAVCLSQASGPTWVFVNTETDAVVPLTSVLIASP